MSAWEWLGAVALLVVIIGGIALAESYKHDFLFTMGSPNDHRSEQ